MPILGDFPRHLDGTEIADWLRELLDECAAARQSHAAPAAASGAAPERIESVMRIGDIFIGRHER